MSIDQDTEQKVAIVHNMIKHYEALGFPYGDKQAGISAKSIVESGEKCVECGENAAEFTLDFDMIGDLTQLAACTGCAPKIIENVIIALKARKQVDTLNTFAINGLGRS